MKKSVITTILLLISLPTFAQAQNTLWSRTYGDSLQEIGNSVQRTSDGGYIVVGYTESFGSGNGDVYLIKTDSLGETLWSRTYGGSDKDFGYCVQQTSDGGYIVVGYTNSFGAGGSDVYLIKTDSFGDTLWTRTYGTSRDDAGYSIQETSDGGYIVAGDASSLCAGYYDWYLIKTNSLGDTMWSRGYGTNISDVCCYGQQTADGGYIIVGYTYPPDMSDFDIYLIKTDSLGDTLWTRRYEGDEWDFGWSVQETSDGGYIVAGYTSSFGVFDVFLIKTDSFGDTLWARTYGGSDDDHGFSVRQTSDGGYIIAGKTKSYGNSGYDLFLIKTDSLGNTLWSRILEEKNSSYDWFVSIEQTPDGGYIVTGTTDSYGAGDGDLVLTKLDVSGNTCVGEFVTPNVMSAPFSVASQTCVVASPATIVTNPLTKVMSPPTKVTNVCRTTSIKVEDSNNQVNIRILDMIKLYQNYPNPFNIKTVIRYYLPHDSKIKITIYNILGQKVKVLLDEYQDAGFNSVVWNGKSEMDIGLPSGVYFYKIQTKDFAQTKKMLLLK